MSANLRERCPGRACQDAWVTVEIVYCEGWDPATRSIVQPLPEATACERDVAGDQYAILFTGDRPRVLVEVCWAANHAAVWYFDALGRRERRLEFRRWPGERLALLEVEQWAYQADSAEFQADLPRWRRAYWRAHYHSDGQRVVSSSGWEDRPDLVIEPTSHAVPAFGDWAAVIGDIGPTTVRVNEPPAGPLDELPWHPPVPTRPRQLDATFEPGTKFQLDDASEVVVELVEAGRLRLPSGRLIVADPDPWMHEVAPFVETVPPGEYPVELAVVRFTEDGEHTRVAACRLPVSARPTVSWDNAWRPGEHELLLGDGEFFGVGVDTGQVALVDAAAAAAYENTIEDAYDDLVGLSHEVPEPASGSASGANLITVSSGWGDGAYPVWVGRDADAGLTCFVVDFLVLAHARRLG